MSLERAVRAKVRAIDMLFCDWSWELKVKRKIKKMTNAISSNAKVTVI